MRKYGILSSMKEDFNIIIEDKDEGSEWDMLYHDSLLKNVITR